MAWSERQHTLLRGIGIRVWSPPWVQAGADDAAFLSGPAARAAQAAPGALQVREPTPPSTAFVAAPAAAFVAAPLHPAAAPAASTPAARAQGLDWPALQAAVAQCRACALCDSRTQTVFGVGHRQAQWLVVGEAPGEQEDREGEPFVGPAGQLLDRMLAALQLTRATEGSEIPAARRVYIANTLKCRPPRNRNPSAAELAACEPYLVRQIELLQPRVILAMGRFAVQSLLRSDEPVGRLRGRVHRYQGVPLVVTYHPAYLLRNLSDKAKAWEDLCLAAQVMEGGDHAAATETST